MIFPQLMFPCLPTLQNIVAETTFPFRKAKNIGEQIQDRFGSQVRLFLPRQLFLTDVSWFANFRVLENIFQTMFQTCFLASKQFYLLSNMFPDFK